MLHTVKTHGIAKNGKALRSKHAFHFLKMACVIFFHDAHEYFWMFKILILNSKY
jgi:hypothetical protein